MPKNRLDILLTEKGLAESRNLAQRLVMAGQVRVDGQVVLKPAARVDVQAAILIENGPPFVSRGGDKLLAALEQFNINVNGRVCADVGASTGGFTDCLLQHGASKVYAIDVGYGGLHWKLRNDPRVISMERTNARNVKRLLEPVSLVTVDASFISLKILLPVIRGWYLDDIEEIIALIKPQFEAGRQEVSRGEGVIHDPEVHRKVLLDVLTFADQIGLASEGLMPSPLRGPKGNVEFLARFTRKKGEIPVDWEGIINSALAQVRTT